MTPLPQTLADSGDTRLSRLTGWILYRLTDRPANSFKARLVIVAVVLGLGWLDFFTGVRVSLQFFYLFPIALSVAWLGWRAGVITSIACLVVRQASDYLDGDRFAHPLVLVWNRLVEFGVYFAVVWIFYALLRLHHGMEKQIRQRTAALTEEIAERERLESVVMSITERERWSIGHELHDGLCQHFTATALSAQSLVRRLEKDRQPTAADAQRLVALIEDGIGQTRRLARGLLLVSVQVDGLAHALRELAATSEEQFRLPCDFRLEGELHVEDSLTATHIFRIAQEAVRNAARHGRAKRVALTIVADAGQMSLRVADDGVGLPTAIRSSGMGLRIMARRAQIIGASFSVESAPNHGTVVTCTWMRPPARP